MERQVTRSGKDANGDITKLCNGSEYWSPRLKADAISDIENGVHRYYVLNRLGQRTSIKVVNGPTGKYLRTDPNDQFCDNLDELPNC